MKGYSINKTKIWQVCMLAACFLMMLSVAVVRDHSIFGHPLVHHTEAGDEPEDPMTINSDGSLTINTETLASETKGYAGPTPLEVIVTDGCISAISPLRNAETPSFFKRATERVLPQFEGCPVDEASTLAVDAATGATMSSEALAVNVRAAAAYAAARSGEIAEVQYHDNRFSFSWEWVAALIVALCGALLPLFVKSKGYRLVQLVANVAVLGFWSGTFLSYSRMVGILTGGFEWLAALTPLIMLVAAFIYPVFGRPNHYCTWICPLGSLQDLASSITGTKIPMKKSVVKWLTAFRQLLWVGLMAAMWVGVAFVWMDYEPFSAFLFTSASWVVIALAGVFVVLSFFVPRPYCRFVCPTGTLVKTATAKPSEK